MKTLIHLLIVLACATSSFVGEAQAVPIPLRGVVEGFYGTPWTFEDRADIIDFCRRNNLNAYVYAPKDDPYHRDQWRTPYPADKLDELSRLVALAKKNSVRFIFAVSPGLDLDYKDDADFQAMIRKLDALYRVGVRDFAIFFDDIKDKNGRAQAEFLNRVRKNLSGRYKDVAPLITVPTEYYLADMIKGGKLKAYTRDFAATLDPRIVVLYTGRGVVCEGITDTEQAEVNKIFRREVGIWWNYPVNDYPLTEGGERNVKLALGAIENLPTGKTTAVLFNPMGQVQLSKIALSTGAVYANNPATYDAAQAWEETLRTQFGALAPQMRIFAEHSRHMENSWAKVGAPDAPEFTEAARLALNDKNFAPLAFQLDKTSRAVDVLLKRLPQKILSECQPQLEQLKRIIQADRIALASLKTGQLDERLKTLREEIASHETQAVISETAGRKFIDDVLKLLDDANDKKRHKK